MDEVNNNNLTAEEEAELDAKINESVKEVRAGNELTPESTTNPTGDSQGATGATGASQTPPKEEDPSNPQPEVKKEEYEFRVPNKGKFESDESYELRIKLLDQVKRRKAATTPEAKEALSAEISRTKGQLKNLNGGNKDNINNLNKVVEEPKPGETEDPALAADRERLRQLGGVTKEEVLEMARQERVAIETETTLKEFVKRTPELQDADVREVFFDFVEDNYVWQGKTGKELLTVLELARENMFRPSQTIQDRVLKGADVHSKINAMDFQGNTGNAPQFSAEKKKSIEELKATGMSEEKAIELLED